MLNKRIKSDLEVLSYLANYSDVVTITHRKDGGLDVDVKSKAFHKDKSNYSSIKHFLRSNGFYSRIGIHSRQEITSSMSSELFTQQYLISEDILNDVGVQFRKMFPDMLDDEFDRIVAKTDKTWKTFQ